MKRISKKEIIFIRENLNQSNEELAIALKRTPKSIKHTRNKLAKITDEVIDYIRKNAKCMSTGEMEKELSLEPSTVRLACTLYDIELSKSKSLTWTDDEIEKLKSIYPTKGVKETAREMDMSETRIRVMASKLGLKRDYAYSEEEQETIIKDFLSGKAVCEIANEKGRTTQAIYNLLYRKGIDNPESTSSRYYVTAPERYIINFFNKQMDAGIPDKTKYENRKYFWGIVGRYEIDIPIYKDGKRYAIEYNGEHWHKGKEESDNKKYEALRKAGFKVFVIDSKDHGNNYYDLSSLDKICFEIMNEILKETGSR